MNSCRPKIAVIGSSNVDFIMRLERLPGVGETVSNGEFLQTFGGKGANQAVAAARAGGDVTFVSCVGGDVFGEQMIGNFQSDGIGTDRILRSRDSPSGSALVMFDRQGDNYLSVAPGANDSLLPEHIDACSDLIAASGFLVMQMEIPIPTIRRALALAAQHGTRVLFNYAPAHTCGLAVCPEMTGLVVNEVEAGALANLRVCDPGTAKAAADALLRQGPQFVVVTLGAAGAWVGSREMSAHIPGFPVVPVDTTAAGDTFCGVLAVTLAEGMSLQAAVRIASAAAALAVTCAGAQPSIPAREATESFLKTHPPA